MVRLPALDVVCNVLGHILRGEIFAVERHELALLTRQRQQRCVSG
jgi:hypothetical protein